MTARKIGRAVVTGPTGAIGNALCERLLREKIEVFAVSHPGSPRTKFLPDDKNLHKIECDAAEYARLPEKVGQADAWFHFAWAHTIGPGRNDMKAQIANIDHTIDAVQAAAKLRCRVFVGAGSQAEYGRVEGVLHADTPVHPENGYGMAKLCAGAMSLIECEKYGIDHVWARVLSVYGPHDGAATMISTAIRTLLKGEKPSFTAGEQLWDYLYASDAAEAFFRMAENGRAGAVYPVGSGKARPLRDYITELRDAIDPALPLGLGDIPYGPRQVMHLEADLSPLTADTGFVPKVRFEDGIRKTIDWVKTQI